MYSVYQKLVLMTFLPIMLNDGPAETAPRGAGDGLAKVSPRGAGDGL